MNRWLIFLSIGLAAQAFAVEPTRNGPLSSADELASFRLHDPNLVVELVAAEPQVESPVALAWDADGRLFVAEMSDYPLDPQRGRIRLLKDRNGDGRYEHSQVFATDIPFPTGVLASRDGVLVASAPDILFLRDVNGDGQCDERTVLLTGFGEGNQQLRVNGLVWGADNWIYGANGRSGGNLRRPDDASQDAVSINGRDFRFRPDGSAIEPVTGQSQFGMARDDWGERFCSWNTIPLRHALLPQSILQMHPQLTNLACRDIADPADGTQVFAISPTPQTFNKEPTEYYNALCGLTVFRGDGLGDEYIGDAFVCESLRNLVHRRKLVPDGPSYRSQRAVPGAEFLASADPWFHPVFLATGPDGALYIADFYRRWVEHPQWVADADARQQVNWREGASHGRIWRVRRRDAKLDAAFFVSLHGASTLGLAAQLASENGWRRDTAQRLLVERQDTSVKAALEALARKGSSPQVRLHALWALAGLNSLENQLLAEIIGDRDPRVRRQGIRLSMPMLAESPTLRGAVLQAAGDADPGVRFETAIAIGAIDSDEKNSAIDRLANFRNDSIWDGAALQLALGRSAEHYLNRMLLSTTVDHEPTHAQYELLANLGRIVGRNRQDREIAAFVSLLTSEPAVASRTAMLAILSGFAQGLAETSISVRQLRCDPAVNGSDSMVSLSKLLIFARESAIDEAISLYQRLGAIQSLTYCGTANDVRPLAPLLAAGNPQDLAEAAADALARAADQELAVALFADWNSYSTSTRRALATSSLRSLVTSQALIEAIESDTIVAVEIEPNTRDALLQLPSDVLAKRAQQIFADVTPAARAKVLADHTTALTLDADPHRGADLVTQHCLNCHPMQGRGVRIGPDLTSVRSHPKEQILISLLDPSRQVSPDFIVHTLITTDGQLLSGIVESETAATVTLRRADGRDETVPRDHIESLRANGKSMMPDGLEQKLSVQDVADVLAFLTKPEARRSQKVGR